MLKIINKEGVGYSYGTIPAVPYFGLFNKINIQPHLTSAFSMK